MVREDRLVLDIEDIRAVEFDCPSCGHECIYPLRGSSCPGPKCSSCGETLTDDFKLRRPDYKSELLHLLRKILSEKRPVVKARLVVTANEEENGKAKEGNSSA